MKNVARNTKIFKVLLKSVKVLRQERILFDDVILTSMEKHQSTRILKEQCQDRRLVRLVQRKILIAFVHITTLHKLQLNRRYKIDTTLTHYKLQFKGQKIIIVSLY